MYYSSGHFFYSFIICGCFLLSSCSTDLTKDLQPAILESTIDEVPLPVNSPTTIVESTPAPTPAPPSAAPAAAPVVLDEPPKEEVASDEKAIPMTNVPTFGYYVYPSNSNPIFSKECLLAESPAQCSSEQLASWIMEQIKYADIGLAHGETSIQYIVFEIDKYGQIFNIDHIGSDGDTFCWPCVEKAIELVQNMPDWVPAFQNGHAVNTSLKLPIRFEGI